MDYQSTLRVLERIARARREVPTWRREDHVLLASYPRSGNTWLRFILANLIRELRRDGPRVDFHTLGRYVPDTRRNRTLAGRIEAAGVPLFLKTHAPWTRHFRDYRAVVVVRHPANVLPSHYEHLREGAKRRLPRLSRFIRHWRYGAAAWREWYLGWYEHAGTIIRYEDMLAEPEACLSHVLDQLQVRVPPAVLRTALERSSREQMRQALDQYGDPNLPNPGFEFVGRDSARTARAKLDKADREFVIRVTEPALALYGYVNEPAASDSQ